MDERAGHDSSLDYHQRMVADAWRMTAYERALRAVVRPGDVVLDVGAGTGVLSLMAAKLGARVIAVESTGIAEVIGALAFQNGVADRITVQRADMRSLPVLAEVDVIVSECLGRMLVDDGMLDALEAARRWLVPDGRVIPSEVALHLAPVALTHFPALDTWTQPILGLDLSPLAVFAEHQSYAATIDPSQLIAAPARCGHWVPGAPVCLTPTTFTTTHAGRLRGLAGWFHATLAPDITLTNAPGFATHWQQLLLPLPATDVARGAEINADLRVRTPLGWAWDVTLDRVTRSRANGGLSAQTIAPRASPLALDLAAEHAAGVAALAAGDARTAAGHFARVVAALDPRSPATPALWENVGLALHQAGLHAQALAPLMRALDGQPSAREQSLRLLVEAAFAAGHDGDGARWLVAYESAFGPHPTRTSPQPGPV